MVHTNWGINHANVEFWVGYTAAGELHSFVYTGYDANKVTAHFLKHDVVPADTWVYIGFTMNLRERMLC